MKINRKPLAELKNLNIIDFFEYGDEYDDFFGQKLDNGDQDIKVKYFNDLSDAKDFFSKMCDVLENDSDVDQRVIVILTKLPVKNLYSVGLIEEDQFSIWFHEMGITAHWDINKYHSDIKDWIEFF